jgi:hypothetical protein
MKLVIQPVATDLSNMNELVAKLYNASPLSVFERSILRIVYELRARILDLKRKATIIS